MRMAGCTLRPGRMFAVVCSVCNISQTHCRGDRYRRLNFGGPSYRISLYSMNAERNELWSFSKNGNPSGSVLLKRFT